MPLETVYTAEVQHLQILDEQGQLDEELAAEVRDVLTDDKVRELYCEMITSRVFDEAAFKLQRAGRMGTFPQNKGQEAATLGPAVALRRDGDQIVPSYRENIALMHHGLPMHTVLLHWMGDERGNVIPEGVGVTPVCVAIGAHIAHAAGHAMALKHFNQANDTDRVAMCFFGDGATSEGAFHDGLNFASVTKAPCIFVVQNNGWAISVPTHKQTASETFAQKAIAYGMPTLRVDGNDLFATYYAARKFTEAARRGEGPALIEAVTYRLADHTTADDAKRYRDPAEVAEAEKKDPFIRTRKFLEDRDLWDENAEQAQWDKARRIVREVVEAATKTPKPNSNDIFDYVFATPTPELIQQRDTRRTSSLGQQPQQGTLRNAPASSPRQAVHS
ncbi:MAG: pyruvate dehydrogenase (acetyl-transferring) E1 component subunit alpha [Planctomycetota bacterium]